MQPVLHVAWLRWRWQEYLPDPSVSVSLHDGHWHSRVCSMSSMRYRSICKAFVGMLWSTSRSGTGGRMS